MNRRKKGWILQEARWGFIDPQTGEARELPAPAPDESPPSVKTVSGVIVGLDEPPNYEKTTYNWEFEWDACYQPPVDRNLIRRLFMVEWDDSIDDTDEQH
jgi:hypothetical protein